MLPDQGALARALAYSQGALTHIRACLQARLLRFANRYTSVNLSATEILSPSPCVIPDAFVNNL